MKYLPNYNIKNIVPVSSTRAKGNDTTVTELLSLINILMILEKKKFIIGTKVHYRGIPDIHPL